MRRQYFYWTYLVLAIVLTIYGGYTLVYHFNHSDKLSVLSLVFLIIGSLMLLLYLALYLFSLKNKRKSIQETAQNPTSEKEQELVEEPKPQQIEKEIITTTRSAAKNNEVVYEKQRFSIYDTEDVYVKKVGYGPVLRVTGNRILDMRSNTYYRVQGSIVSRDGSGQVFEINGNQIRSAFGGYLYEISGSNINKVFGGFYASISGNYITLFDLSEKYETTGSLNQKQLLVVAALLFGTY